MVGFVVFFCTDVTRCHGFKGLLDCFYMILTVCLVFEGGGEWGWVGVGGCGVWVVDIFESSFKKLIVFFV